MTTHDPDNGEAGGSGGDEQESEQPLRRDEDADPVQIHRDYVERRIGGGAPPTSDAYAQAIEQFQQLPGAVRTPPTETTEETARVRARPARIPPDAQARAKAHVPEEEAEAEEAGAEEGPPDDDTSGVWEQDR